MTDVLLHVNHAEPVAGRVLETWSFRRSNYFAQVGRECRHVHEKVGLLDMSAFAKFEISGPGAEAWLDGFVAGRLPRKVGRIGLCYHLTPRGGVRAEFTVYRAGVARFYIVSAGALETHDRDCFERALPRDGSVRLECVTERIGVLVVAGPEARRLLERVTDADMSDAAFPWLSGRTISVGAATVLAMRVNYVGELGWELHHPISQQNAIFDALMGAGLDLRPFGIKAMESLRLEKSYKAMGRELSIEYAALESGLERFVALDKGDFVGREGLVAWRDRGFANACVTLEVHGVTDADARGSEPIWLGEEIVGRATSGGYGWRVGASLALGMVRPDLAVPGTALQIEILGVRHGATVVMESPFDPGNARLKG